MVGAAYLFTMRGSSVSPFGFVLCAKPTLTAIQCSGEGGREARSGVSLSGDLSRGNLKLYLFRRAFCGLAPQRLSRASTKLSVVLLLPTPTYDTNLVLALSTIIRDAEGPRSSSLSALAQ